MEFLLLTESNLLKYVKSVTLPTVRKKVTVSLSPNRYIEQLKSQADRATDEPLVLADKGRVLKRLHDQWIPVNRTPGSSQIRKLHYEGYSGKHDSVEKDKPTTEHCDGEIEAIQTQSYIS